MRRCELVTAFPGQEAPVEEDNVITALDFDRTGNVLACGTKSGGVVLYQRQDEKARSGQSTPESGEAVEPVPPVAPGKGGGATRVPASPKIGADSPGRTVNRKSLSTPTSLFSLSSPTAGGSWSVYHQFISHKPQFDYLKSLEVEAKINMIKFCQPVSATTSCLLTTNDKCIKLWKVSSQDHSYIPGCLASYNEGGTAGHLFLPYKMARQPDQPKARAFLRKDYKDAHTYHINSLAVCSDCETFLSADDLRINLWRLDRPDVSLCFADLKPEKMEDLAEVITCAAFHPLESNVLGYATSRGAARLVDLRDRCLGNSFKEYVDPEEESAKGFFSEIIASASDICFDPSDPNKFLTRDYMCVRVWDLRQESRATTCINVHEHVRPLLGELYEADAICDKFSVACSPDGKKFVTGSYNNQFVVKHLDGRTFSTGQLPPEGKEVAKVPTHRTPPKPPGGERPAWRSKSFADEGAMLAGTASETDDGLASDVERVREIRIARGGGQPDIRADQKAARVAWSPAENILAVANLSGVYLFNS